MPRRGSKAQLVHLLAEVRAYAIREIYGDMGIYPQHFYHLFRPFSLEELQEMAVGITPTKVGRPKRGSRYAQLAAEVDEMRARRKGISMRSACKNVADNHKASKVSAKALRTYCRNRHAGR